MSTPIAVRSNQQLDPNLLLGHLLFMVVDELKIHKQDLADLFKKHQLSQRFLPHQIKPHDAYRRATSKASGTIEIQEAGQIFKARLLVREVKKDDDRIVRHLVRELIDEKNEETRYVTVGKLIFDRNKEVLDISWDYHYLGEYDYQKVLEDTQDLFNEWTQYHTKDTVRNIMSKVIKAMHPVSVSTGGRAQFIPKTNTDMLYSLKSVIEELPGTSVAEVIPMIDTVDQRSLVTKNLEREVLFDVDRLLEDFSQLLQAGTPIRTTTVKRYAGMVVELQDKTHHYEGLLQSKMSVLNQQLSLALQQVQSAQTEEEIA